MRGLFSWVGELGLRANRRVDTHPAVPDAQLRWGQHREESSLGIRLDMKRLLLGLQRTQKPLGPAAEKIHGCRFPSSREAGSQLTLA